jgi:hypothetical protein
LNAHKNWSSTGGKVCCPKSPTTPTNVLPSLLRRCGESLRSFSQKHRPRPSITHPSSWPPKCSITTTILIIVKPHPDPQEQGPIHTNRSRTNAVRSHHIAIPTTMPRRRPFIRTRRTKTMSIIIIMTTTMPSTTMVPVRRRLTLTPAMVTTIWTNHAWSPTGTARSRIGITLPNRVAMTSYSVAVVVPITIRATLSFVNSSMSTKWLTSRAVRYVLSMCFAVRC